MKSIFFQEKITNKDIKVINSMSKKDINKVLSFINNNEDYYINKKDYYINKKDINSLQKKTNFNEFYFIGEGQSGIVYRYKNYAIKIFKSSISDWYSDKDAKILSTLNNIDLYPKLFAECKNKFIVMRHINGVSMNIFKKGKVDRNYEENLFKSFIETTNRGYIPCDLHDENAIIDKKGNLKIIDVGCFKKIEEKLSKEDCIDRISSILKDFIIQNCYYINKILNSPKPQKNQ